MDPYRKKNLKIESPGLGKILVQPERYEEEEIKEIDVLIIPVPLADRELEAAEECLANSNVPAFCAKPEISRLDSMGFGSYRFYKLDGFEEISFSGGTITFYPAKVKKQGLSHKLKLFFKGLFSSTYEDQAFHFVVSGHGEPAVLFLASPLLDSVDWELLNKINPRYIVGSNHYKPSEWKAVEKRFGKKIIFQNDSPVLKTSSSWTQREKTPDPTSLERLTPTGADTGGL